MPARIGYGVMGRSPQAGVHGEYGSMVYLLQDTFPDDLAAGAVNGTAAVPGGILPAASQLRNVVDTGNKISTSGGWAVSAGFTAVTDPRLYYGPITRQPGLTAKITTRWATQRGGVGWSSATNATGPGLGMTSYSGTLTPSQPFLASFAQALALYDYTLWLTLFTTGGAIWAQGGGGANAYANPTLLCVDEHVFTTAGNMYFYAIMTTGTDTSLQSQNLQIRVIPQLATAQQLSTVYITSPVNGVNYTTVADAIHQLTLAQPGSPQAGDKLGIRYRYSSVTNYWYAYIEYNGGTSQWDFKLDKVVDNVTTNLTTVANVGTVTHLQVYSYGNLHVPATGTASAWAKRGSNITDAALNTATEVGAWYTAGTCSLLSSYPRTWSL